MVYISVKQKMELGESLAKGHRKFGKVLPRRPYYKDDEDGGSGAAQHLFETHPLLSDLPVGAPSDLAFIIEENGQTIAELEKREDQAAPQLRKALQQALRYGYKPPAVLTPYS